MFESLKSLFKKPEIKIPIPQKEVVQALKPAYKNPYSVDNTYNSQKNNKVFIRIPPSSQCGYTSIGVVICKFLGYVTEAMVDDFIYSMILQFEKGFLNGTASRFGASMSNHKIMYEHYINKHSLNKEVVFIPYGGTIEDIKKGLLSGSAVEVSGMMTSSGHFMAIVEWDEFKKAFRVQDPWAKFDFKTGKYTNESGANVWYSYDDFMPYLHRSAVTANKVGGIRMIYLKDKKI